VNIVRRLASSSHKKLGVWKKAGPSLKNALSRTPPSGLNSRILRAFAFFVIAPAAVLSLFSVAFLHFGMQIWFNEKVQTALKESQAVASAYLDEHQQVIKNNVRMMAADIRGNLSQLLQTPGMVDGFLTLQSELRSLNEAVLMAHDGQVLGRSQFSFSLEFEGSTFNLERASYDTVIYPNQRNDRVIAITLVDPGQGFFLVASRKVDQKVLERILATEKAVSAYKALLKERSLFSWSFLVLFLGFTVLLLVLALWRGLVFSKQFLDPIERLIQAARQIQQGDFHQRVETGHGPRIDELETLARAFNQMVDEIGLQQQELRQTHEELERRHQFTENVLAGISAGILGLDEFGKIHLANERAFELLRSSPDKVIGQELQAVLPELSLEGVSLPFETKISWGLYKTFRVHVTGRSGADSTVGETVITFEDMTHFLAIQRQAAWSDVARRVAHEIKNPLTPIQLSAERLKRRYLPQIQKDPESFDKCVETIMRQVDVLGRIISEFSAFARMPRPSFVDVDLSELLENAFFLQKHAYPTIDWTLNAPPSFFWVCDPQQITQVLTNLLKNSVEATQERAKKEKDYSPAIQICLFPQGKTVDLEIVDNGVGLNSFQKQTFAEPYITTKDKGTGLGLAIVKKIVEDHGGMLTLVSDSLEGVHVRIRLCPLPVTETRERT
jgi:two-component system nitrogen regulation sensor histidine kinase NtrY